MLNDKIDAQQTNYNIPIPIIANVLWLFWFAKEDEWLNFIIYHMNYFNIMCSRCIYYYVKRGGYFIKKNNFKKL